MKQLIAILLILFLVGCAAQQAPQTPPAPSPTPQPAAQPAPTSAPTPVPAPQTVVHEPVTSPGPAPTINVDPILLKQGYFHKVTHYTDGRVQIYRKPDNTQLMTFTGFDTEPGPGLSVVLHSGDITKGYTVSTLVSASGNYPYPLPNDLNIKPFTKVAIYNKKYNVIWGEAELK